MSTGVATDPRLAAFLAPDCLEVFHSVATPTAIWEADPYDVETIHSEAREAFERLLYRGGRIPPPDKGAVLVLHGEAGSGKTHLMRAFRTRAHRQGLAYCAYLQMTTEVSNYARYMLTNLIDSLDQPYAPEGPVTRGTALMRLSAALLESVPGLTGLAMESFRDGEFDAALADDYADRLQASNDRFRGCDLELMRVMLHLQRNEPRAHSRALMWLRCQDMRPQDRQWIGMAIPRTDEADPARMLKELAKLIDAIHGVPLVFLIDQLEDIEHQSAPVERFVKLVDAITAFTDQNPNGVVVLACLENYFKDNEGRLSQSKHDRLVRDPEPIRLLGNRTHEEVRLMTARRLAHLYDTREVEADPHDDLYPFREEHLSQLAGKRSRDVLDSLRRHHQHCITNKRWVEPDWSLSSPTRPQTMPNDLDALWNDFHSTFAAEVPDDEEELAGVLANAIRATTAELADGFHFGCPPPDGRYLEVEVHKPGNIVEKRLVALCNAGTRGVGFINQISELAARAGEIPVAIVRTTDFPRAGKAITQIAAMLKRHGNKVVVSNSDWRRMLAFEAFRKEHGKRPDFAAWQRTARPLGELSSLRGILRLDALAASAQATAAAMPHEAVAEPEAPLPRSAAAPLAGPPAAAAPVGAPTGLLLLGRTLGLTPSPVTLEADEFVKHASFLGGTGSGKTTAALNLIEQLLARNVPAVLIDRKGDLCRYAEPAAWERPLDDPARAVSRQALRDKLDVALFTPGEPNGRPLALPLVPPGFDQLHEADRERFAQYAAGALGAMIGFKSSDADKGQRAILAKAIETLASVPDSVITLPVLRDLIERQDDALLNAIGGGYPDRYFLNLAQRLLTLELNNRQLLTGSEQLDLDALLGTGSHSQPGRVRLTVVSTRFLEPSKLDFWVSQLLVAIARWCAKSPRPRLQAVFLFDEADIYLPAGTRQPATKGPMEDLLKRARSAGVSIFLATQSPGDFDYRCKENVRTWLIGGVKEPRALEKLKPMLAAAKGNVLDKLAAQGTGEFHLVRESTVTAVRSDESFIRTEQLSEDRILQLARQSRTQK